MTVIDLGDGRPVYVDSNIFVYYVEAVTGFFEPAQKLFDALSECGAAVVTSELTLAECIYRPARDGYDELIAIYEQVLAEKDGLRLVPLSGDVVKAAAMTGGALGLKLMDAIHYTTALKTGCGVFVTNDRKFKSHPDMRVLSL